MSLLPQGEKRFVGAAYSFFASLGASGWALSTNGSAPCLIAVASARDHRGPLDELPGSILEGVGGDVQAQIGMVEHVERFRQELQREAVAHEEAAGEAHVGGGIIGAVEAVTRDPGQAVVGAIGIAVGVADDAGVHRTSAAVGHGAGDRPVIEHLLQHHVVVVEGLRRPHPGDGQPVALVGDAHAVLRVRLRRVLHRGRGDDGRILSIVIAFAQV